VLAELKDAGLIEYVGVSDVRVEQPETARDIVDTGTVQNRYDAADRDHGDVTRSRTPTTPRFASRSSGDLSTRR